MTAIGDTDRVTPLEARAALATRSGRQFWWRHPELPVVALTGAAWLALALDHWANHDRAVAEWRFRPFWWSVMVVAMMVPGLVPMYRRVAFESMWHRRHRTPLLFTAAYVSLWITAGLLGFAVVSITTAFSGIAFDPGPIAVPVVLAAALAWQLAPAKGRFLRACHLRRPIAPRGWRADRDAVRYGLVQGRSCVGSCGPIMLAMFVGGHDFHLLIPLAVVTIAERLRRQPDVRNGAIVLAVVAPLALLGSL